MSRRNHANSIVPKENDSSTRRLVEGISHLIASRHDLRSIEVKGLGDPEFATIEALRQAVDESPLKMGNVAHATHDDALEVNRGDELTEERTWVGEKAMYGSHYKNWGQTIVNTSQYRPIYLECLGCYGDTVCRNRTWLKDALPP